MNRTIFQPYIQAHLDAMSEILKKLQNIDPDFNANFGEDVKKIARNVSDKHLASAITHMENLRDNEALICLCDNPTVACVAAIVHTAEAAYQALSRELLALQDKLAIEYPNESSLIHRVNKAIADLSTPDFDITGVYVHRNTTKYARRTMELPALMDKAALNNPADPVLIDNTPQNRAAIRAILEDMARCASYFL